MATVLLIVGLAALVYLLWDRCPQLLVFPTRGKMRLSTPPAPVADDLSIDLVGVPVDTRLLTLGVLFLGVQGTGKSVGMLRARAGFYKQRAREVALDIKNDLLPPIEAMLPLDRPIYMMNVFDSHPAVMSLNLADTFTDSALAQRLGLVLVENVKGNPQPFFADAARILVVAVIVVFQSCRLRARRAWRLRDILAVCFDRELLEAVLDTEPSTRSKFAQVMNHGDSANDVFATLHSCLSRFEPYAVADCGISQQLSIAEFIAGTGVMILGVAPQIMKVQLPLYQLLLLLIVEASLSVQAPDSHMIISLDEIAMVENIGELVVTAAAVGRSSNLAILAATQSIALLRERLGQENANALLAVLQTVVAFRVGSLDDATWAASMMGKYEGTIWKPTWNPASRSTTWSADSIEQYLVHPQELMNLPLADAASDQMSCCIGSSILGTLKVTGSLLGAVKDCPRPGSYEYKPRDFSRETLKPLTEQDCHDLGISISDNLLAYFSKRVP